MNCQCTKFEVAGLSCYKNISGVQKLKKLDRWLWSRPFQGWLAIGRLGLIVTNIHTKFEAHNFARYEARNGDAKCRKWDGFGSLKVISNVTIRYSTYDFLFNFNRNYASIPLMRYSEFFVESCRFFLPHLRLVTSLRVTPFEFQDTLCC